MKSKSEKSSQETDEKIKKEKQHAAIIDWFVRIIIARTLKELYKKMKLIQKDEV